MSALWMASYILLWGIVIVLAFMVMGLLRQLGLIQLRMGIEPGVLITPEGLERGVEAPDFEAIDVQTQRLIRLDQFRGKRVVLLFLSPNCLACRELIPHFNEVARAEQGKIEVLAVCYGAESVCGEFARQFHVHPTLVADPTNAIAARYQVRVTPFAFLIDEYGLVLIRGIINSWPQLEALLEEEGTLQEDLPWQLRSKQPDLNIIGTVGLSQESIAPQKPTADLPIKQ